MKSFHGGPALVLGISLALCGPASAQIVALNNLPGTAPFTSGDQLGNAGNNAGARQWAAVELTNNGVNASLVDASAVFTNLDPQANHVVTGGVYSDVGGSPGALLVAFNQQTILIGQADITKTFIPAAPFTLTGGGTKFWFAFTGDVGLFAGAHVWRRDTINTAPVPAPFFATTGYKVSADNATTWAAGTNNDLVRIRVAVNGPEPSSLALLSFAALGVVVRRRLKR